VSSLHSGLILDCGVVASEGENKLPISEEEPSHKASQSAVNAAFLLFSILALCSIVVTNLTTDDSYVYSFACL